MQTTSDADDDKQTNWRDFTWWYIKSRIHILKRNGDKGKKKSVHFYQRRERIHVQKSLSLHFTWLLPVCLNGIDKTIQNHQRNSQVIIIINQLYTDRHCGINVAIRKSATATDEEKKIVWCEPWKRRQKNTDSYSVHHINACHTFLIYYIHILSFHVCTLHRFVACFGIHNFQPHFLPTCCIDILLPISQDSCMLLLPLFSIKKMINRFFSLFKWARTITSFQVNACACVWHFLL